MSEIESFVLDVARLHGAVAERPLRMHGFAGNAVYRVGDVVVKLALDGRTVASEERAMQEAARAGIRVPEVLGCGAEPHPHLVMRFVEGTPAWDDPAAMTVAGRELRRLHEVEPGGPGVGWLTDGVPDSDWWAFVQRGLAVMADLADAGLLPTSDVDAAGRLLEQHRAQLSCEPRILHGDMHPRHVLTRGGEVVALIDWQDALLGDPAFEIGRLARCESAYVLDAFLEGYAPDDALAARLPVAVPCYAMLWSAWSAAAELRAKSDWVRAHIAAIRSSLWELS